MERISEAIGYAIGMNIAEARRILIDYLVRYRSMSYGELAGLIGKIETGEVTSDTGTQYQIEVSFFWDNPARPNEVLRVLGSIDDGGIRAFAPLCESFLVAPDGSFAGE